MVGVTRIAAVKERVAAAAALEMLWAAWTKVNACEFFELFKAI
jgi:hypothetical protein